MRLHGYHRRPRPPRRTHSDATMTTSTRSAGNRGAIYSILAGMFVITLQDTAVKWLSPDYALHQIMFIRAVLALLITLALVRFEGGLRLVRTRRPVLHAVRGALMVATNMLFFLAIAAMPLGEAVALFFVGPLFITVMSVVFLSERVGARRWGAVLVGLCGVTVMMRPGGGCSTGSRCFRWGPRSATRDADAHPSPRCHGQGRRSWRSTCRSRSSRSALRWASRSATGGTRESRHQSRVPVSRVAMAGSGATGGSSDGAGSRAGSAATC